MTRLTVLVTSLFVLWLLAGLVRFHGAARSTTFITGATLMTLAAPLVWWTVQEDRVAAHLTFPVSLLLWPIVGVLGLIGGGVLAVRDRWPVAWPLLGLPASLLLASLLAAALAS